MQIRKIVCGIVLFIVKVVLVVAIVAGLYRLGGYAYGFGYQLYSGKGMTAPPGKDVAVVVSEGDSVKAVGEMLKRQGLIKDSMVFVVQEKLSKYSGQMQAGNYVLNTSQSAEEMLAILSGHGTEAESGEDS